MSAKSTRTYLSIGEVLSLLREAVATLPELIDQLETGRAPSAEVGLIRQHFGDLPLTGFFANGEISHNRLYGYSGVLTLFY